MHGPLLPEEPEDRTMHPRYMPRPEVLRVIAATIAVIGALIGLISRLEQTPAPVEQPNVAPVRALNAPTIYYGALASPEAAHPGKDLDPARNVCTDQYRWKPTSGPWHCAQWSSLQAQDVGRPARDPGGPCTHRLVTPPTRVWRCQARLAAAPLAREAQTNHNLRVLFGGMRSGDDVCNQEARSSATQGRWYCTNWRPLPPGFRVVAPVMPPGPCRFRVPDQLTGNWSCTPALGSPPGGA
jgi:hypothetical protein